MEIYLNRVKMLLEVLKERIFIKENEMDKVDIYRKSITYNQRELVEEEIQKTGWTNFCNGSTWGEMDGHELFKFSYCVPEQKIGKELWLQVKTSATDIWNTDNPQFLVYINGKPVCGMDMNHHEVCLTKNGQADESITVCLYGYSNCSSNSDFLYCVIHEKNAIVEQLYYDCKVIHDIVVELKEDDLERMEYLRLLNEIVDCLELRKGKEEEFLLSAKNAIAFIESMRSQIKKRRETIGISRNYNDRVYVHSIGHTHIDLAWKWPLRQTREKVLRSFSTVLNLMEEYPEYRFMSSQPQLYQFVKEEEPDLFQRIKERVEEGRWEVEGAMWVEADCNLTSGESLIRQIIYGKKFFKDEFNRGDDKVLWLPDVFGYSAAMPQILRKAGIDYFMTTKINWNEYNQFPNDVMNWRGIDGSEILTYFITTTNHKLYPELERNKGFSTTYNGRQNVSQIMGTWQRFQNKDISNHVLTCYGFGDGGGGPTREMLEESRRLEYGDLPCPLVKQTFVREFFDILKEELKGKSLPKWSGELYLEYHRGTYTSMARNKKYNRICEFLMHDIEVLSVIASKLHHLTYPKDKIDELWRILLLNQFHDILPGTSIEEVYIDSQEQYKHLLEKGHDLMKDAMKSLVINSGEEQLIFFNTAGIERSTIIQLSEIEMNILHNNHYEGISQRLQDDTYLIFLDKLPLLGYITSKHLIENYKTHVYNPIEYKETSTNKYLESNVYRVIFNSNGEIISLYDKENNREVVAKGECMNQLIAFEDRPYEYDSWNIDSTYEDKKWLIDDVANFELIENGPIGACIRVKRYFMNSEIIQDIWFYQGKRRIDFKTRIDWREEQILLKAAFPIDVVTDEIICDIQFGNVKRKTHRNTSWDKARFEICAHKWVDLSEHRYGVAILNNCKYGLDVNETKIRLTLLKSGIYPNPNADKEVHTFTYSILPHKGDFRDGLVVSESFDLNMPIIKEIVPSNLLLGERYDGIRSNNRNIVIDTLKLAEDGKGYVLRVYETFGSRESVTLNIEGLKMKEVRVCDLLEGVDYVQESETDIDFENGCLKFIIKPYEIRSFYLK